MEFIESHKSCRSCKEEIRDRAVKCYHCGAFQNWRGYIPLSSTVIALVIALVSVAAVAADRLMPLYSQLNEETKQDQPSISFKLLDDQYFARLLAVNEGQKSGVIVGATLLIGDVDVPGNGVVMLLRNVDDRNNYVIQPGGMSYFEFEFADWENDKDRIKAAKEKGILPTMVVEYAEYQNVLKSTRRIQDTEKFEVAMSLERLMAE